MKKVLVTGSSGQLGRCLRKYSGDFPNLKFVFATSEELDIAQLGVTRLYFKRNEFDYCINCAAYTNVEKAETDREMAFLVNADAVKNLAEICRDQEVTLLHISTDYVFDGRKTEPYSEEDETNPLNVYGASKLSGEDCIQQIMENFFIFRTSWLYSDFGHNFFTSVLKKADNDEVLNITAAQTGTPTNTHDLAIFLLTLISEENKNYGLYHYSNLGEATWYAFAKEILQFSGRFNEVALNEDNSFKTIANRPAYSVLNKEKTQKNFSLNILSWQDSLKQLFR